MPKRAAREIAVVTYTRDLKATEGLTYHEKFEALIRLCAEAEDIKSEEGAKNLVVAIAFPSVIGDTYVEVMESLARIAVADLLLMIAPPPESTEHAEDA